ncbi:EREBP-like factor [Vigna unguiculata]|uniref:EREBP-like factor n=1 Tax=Vigna unguiculata TaxID=3917 RepID=A0A4D6N6R6_VIGUN|nr:EREBP-like factor [Vigna unguiculata]
MNNDDYSFSSSPSSTSSQSQLCNPNSPSENSPLPTQKPCGSHKRKAGRKKFQETRHPVYRGVRQRNGNRWVCEVREPNTKSRIWLGTYSTPEMAARAHDVAALALKGTSAALNFPDSVSLLPVAKSSSAADIRAAAAHVSEVFVSTNTSSSSANDSRVEIDKTVNDVEEFKKSVFFDEEAFYNMPGLLHSMAEGLLITPPSMMSFDWDEVDCETDLTLWTY